MFFYHLQLSSFSSLSPSSSSSSSFSTTSPTTFDSSLRFALLYFTLLHLILPHFTSLHYIPLGTIPIVYHNSTYNIPLEIFVRSGYPQQPPLVYVRPTSSMMVSNVMILKLNLFVYDDKYGLFVSYNIYLLTS